MSLPIALIVIVAVTVMVALFTRGTKLPTPVGVITVGLVIALATIGLAAYSAVQDQRVRDQCTYAVTRSDGNRQQWLDLAAYLEAKGTTSDAIEFVRQRLDVNLPQRSLDEC